MTKFIGAGALALFAGLSVVGCKVENTDLPDGTYPLTFTGTIEQMVTKSSISGTWNGSERVAVLSMSGSDAGVVKNYATDADGLMNASDPFYWSRKNESKELSAWYCGDGSTDAGGSNSTSVSSWAVRGTQTDGGYLESDFLYATGECKFEGDNLLVFYHQISKVVVNILSDSSISDPSEISSVMLGEASIALEGMFEAPSSGNQTGVWTAGASDGEIIPNPVAAGEGCMLSYEALLIPQNMEGKPFIVIDLAGGGRLTYVPTAGEADLLPGFQYVYNVKVGDLKLDVTVDAGVSWEDGETIDIDSAVK